MFVSLTRQVIFYIPLIIMLPRFFGIDGVLFATPIADTSAAIMAAFFISREFRMIGKLKDAQISAGNMVEEIPAK